MSSSLLILTSAGAGVGPLLLIPLGAVLGCLGFLLWGQPGRLDIARRRGFLAHLAGRPVQRLGLGRVCLQCGRMHHMPTTPRELWRSGHFCSVTCLVDAQESDEAALKAERTAEQRMRELFLYAELDRVLQRALTREALTREALARPLPRAPGGARRRGRPDAPAPAPATGGWRGATDGLQTCNSVPRRASTRAGGARLHPDRGRADKR